MNDNKNVSPGAAALVGAIAGAGLAIIGSVALNDEKNKAKLKKVINDLKKMGEYFSDDVAKEASVKNDQIKDKVEEAENVKDDVTEKLEDQKN